MLSSKTFLNILEHLVSFSVSVYQKIRILNQKLVFYWIDVNSEVHFLGSRLEYKSKKVNFLGTI